MDPTLLAAFLQFQANYAGKKGAALLPGGNDDSDDDYVKNSVFQTEKRELWRAIGGLDVKQKANDDALKELKEEMHQMKEEMHQMNTNITILTQGMNQMVIQLQTLERDTQKIMEYLNNWLPPKSS